MTRRHVFFEFEQEDVELVSLSVGEIMDALYLAAGQDKSFDEERLKSDRCQERLCQETNYALTFFKRYDPDVYGRERAHSDDIRRVLGKGIPVRFPGFSKLNKFDFLPMLPFRLSLSILGVPFEWDKKRSTGLWLPMPLDEEMKDILKSYGGFYLKSEPSLKRDRPPVSDVQRRCHEQTGRESCAGCLVRECLVHPDFQTR